MIEDQEKVITGVKFKLNVNNEVKDKLNEYFEEYGKGINFAVRVISNELDPSRLIFAGKKDKETNEWVYPNKDCSCGGDIRYYDGGSPLCQDCYKKRYTETGLRKRMCTVKERKAEHDMNIRNATNKLSKTHFHYVIREAFSIHKSLLRQKKERIRRLFNDRKRLQMFIEMQEGKHIVLPTRERQKVKRYIHPSWRNKEKNIGDFRGYTMTAVRGKIKILDRNIKREEVSLKNKGLVHFRANKIMLNKNLKFDDENKVHFTVSSDLPKVYTIDLPKKGKRLLWLLEKITKIREQKPKYAYLLRKNGCFYLQYTLEEVAELKKNYVGAIGVDRGISFLAVCVLVNNKGQKIKHPLWIKSSEILRMKNLQRERDRFLKGKHNKRRKKKNMRLVEKKISLILHEVSKKIVDWAKEEEAFIVFEKLERIKKSRIRQPKKLRSKLSLFIFKKLSDFVDYKAKREGIEVKYIPPEYTSKECSHCGEKVETLRPFQGNSNLFKCDACGLQLNADYNAAINIARKGLNISDA